MSVPFIRDFDPEYGKAVNVSPLITRITCENPGPFTFTGSGTYIIGKRVPGSSVAIIDPGPDDGDHIDRLADYLADFKVKVIALTHTHRDHCGGAARLQERIGAPVAAFGVHPTSPGTAAPALDEGADFDIVPDLILADSDQIAGADWTLTALHTPGHISNHLCFALEAERALFTGDHVMGWATTVVAPPDGHMGDYMHSLERLLQRNDRVFYPTHGAPITNPREYVHAIRTHRRQRDAAILGTLTDTPCGLMDIVSAVYHDTDKSLHIAAALNVKAHLDLHVAVGRVIQDGAGFPNTSYRLSET